MINIHHLQVIFFQGHILQGAWLAQILKSLLSFLNIGWMLVQKPATSFFLFIFPLQVGRHTKLLMEKLIQLKVLHSRVC